MYKSVPAATAVAAIGILASSASISSVGAVHLVTDQKHAHRQEDMTNWNPDLANGDSQLLETKKQLDQVEEQLNQMKAETEVNLEIAEEESHKKKTKVAKKHNKKSKHAKKTKAQKKHAHKSKRLLDDDDEDDEGTYEYEDETVEPLDEDDEIVYHNGEEVSADAIGDSDSFHMKKSSKTHKNNAHTMNKKHHKSSKKSHSAHLKEEHDPAESSKAAENAEEDDPFAAFEESLTKKAQPKQHNSDLEHHKKEKHQPKQHKVDMEHHEKEKHVKKSKIPISHAQKKKAHKSHANTDSVPACTSLGCKTGSAGAPPPDPWPKDYPVANWGRDHDVETTEKNTAAAEGKLGAWVPKQDADGKYIVPHVDAEFKLAGTQSDIRMSSKSDPICSSAGCTQYEHPHPKSHPIDYFVPNFGKDHLMKQTDESASSAEAQIGHVFTPTQDEDGNWVVPTETAEFKLAGVQEDIRMQKKKHHSKKSHHESHHSHEKHHHKHQQAAPSDPHCSSDGWCGESLWPESRAKDYEHAVLRHDSLKGANQAPTPAEKEINEQKRLKAMGDPRPHSEEPVDPEVKAAKEAMKAAQPPLPDTSDQRKESSLLKDAEWAASHPAQAQQQSKQSLASVKSTHKKLVKGDDKKGDSLSAPVSDKMEMDKNDDDFYDKTSCEQRKKGGKSELIPHGEYTKCNSFSQKSAEQKQINKKAPQSLATIGKKNVNDDKQVEKKDPVEKKSDPICSSAGWCGEPWPEHMKDKTKVVEYKTGLPLDKDIKDTQKHIKDQEKEHGEMTLKPSSFVGNKADNKHDQTKLQTMVDVRSDPAYNSDDGYETRHMNPSDEKEIVKYKTDVPYDSDIVDSQKHLKQMEGQEGHKLDPVPYLTVQTKDQDIQDAQALADIARAQEALNQMDFAPQTSAPSPQNIVQEKSKQKTAVKSESKTKGKVEAKAKVQTKAEKMNNFVAMRKKMMSNWGTK